ncbi:MAG: hypothetical protein AAGA18_06270 [Verrucomicrobiota bacterium]
MALIFKLECDKCDFTVGPTGGGHLYVTLDDGSRKPLPHPAEFSTALDATGKELPELQKEKRIGSELQYLCLACGHDLYLDPSKDVLVCPVCTSDNLIDMQKVKKKACPKCKEGHLRQEHIGIS